MNSIPRVNSFSDARPMSPPLLAETEDFKSQSPISGISTPKTDNESLCSTKTYSSQFSEGSKTPAYTDSSDDSSSPFNSDEEKEPTKQPRYFSQFDGIEIDWKLITNHSKIQNSNSKKTILLDEKPIDRASSNNNNTFKPINPDLAIEKSRFHSNVKISPKHQSPLAATVDELYRWIKEKAKEEENKLLITYRTDQINWYSTLIEKTNNFESESANIRKLNKAFKEFIANGKTPFPNSNGSDLYEKICQIYERLNQPNENNTKKPPTINPIIDPLTIARVNALFKKAELARCIHFLKKSNLHDEAKENKLEHFSLPHPSTIKDKKLKAVVNAYNAIFKTRENLKQNLHNFIHGRQLTIDFNKYEFLAILTCGNDQVAKRFIGEIKKEYMESVDSK